MIVGKILERGFVYDGHGVALMIGAINSVVVALPYALLYIALGVLADRVGPANAKADPLRG
jgi:hypothetical protein